MLELIEMQLYYTHVGETIKNNLRTISRQKKQGLQQRNSLSYPVFPFHFYSQLFHQPWISVNFEFFLYVFGICSLLLCQGLCCFVLDKRLCCIWGKMSKMQRWRLVPCLDFFCLQLSKSSEQGTLSHQRMNISGAIQIWKGGLALRKTANG